MQQLFSSIVRVLENRMLLPTKLRVGSSRQAWRIHLGKINPDPSSKYVSDNVACIYTSASIHNALIKVQYRLLSGSFLWNVFVCLGQYLANVGVAANELGQT